MSVINSKYRNLILSCVLLAGITFSVVTIALATAPDPGHNFSEVSGGVAQGDLLYGSAADTILALPKSITATRYLANTGTSNNPAWAQVDVTNGVTGILPGANGGTGVANSAKTITLGGNLTTAGAFGTTLTVTGTTAVTLPTSGTLMNNPLANTGDMIYAASAGAPAVPSRLVAAPGFLKSATTTAPVWSTVNLAAVADVTGILPAANGGTGVANTGNTITLGGNVSTASSLSTVGAFGLTLTTTGITNVTLPTSGTLMLNPMTTSGDVIYGGASGVPTRLATAAGFFKSTGVGSPFWSTLNLASSTDVGASILSGTNGGTGNGFFNVTGPTVTPRFFAFPNASASVLTDNADVTVSQGGTGLSTLTANNVILGNGTSTPNFVAPGAAGNLLESNGSTWISAVGGVLIGVQKLTTGTTYTPTAGTTKIFVRLWGGGGAGAGCSAVAGCAGGGGSSGGYAEYFLTGVSGTYSYVIGAGGTGVSGATGGNGTDTTFNSGAVVASHGVGAAFSVGSAAIKFMQGGGVTTSTGGLVNGAGTPGCIGVTSTVASVVASGCGGSTSLGGGGNSRNTTGAGFAGIANTGSGGSGAAAETAVAGAGGDGADGVIVIYEFR